MFPTKLNEEFRDNSATKINRQQNLNKSNLTPKNDSLLDKIKQIILEICRSFTTKNCTSKNVNHGTSFLETKKISKVSNPQLDLLDGSSIIYNQSTKEYVYISKAPPIENLVISGGGAKGVILLGVLKAFESKDEGEDLSFRDQLKNIAGSSIGAITAGLIAAGISSEDFNNATDSINFKDLLGKGIGPVHKSGQPLLDFMRSNLRSSISGHLQAMFGDKDVNQVVREQVKDKNYSKEKTEKIIEDVNKILTIKKDDINEIAITFSMLHSLHELNPTVFKDLTVTATCRENGKTFYFDAEKTPDLDIAVACRASASLPFILIPVSIGQDALSPYYKVPKEGLTFVDGGYFDNIPVSAMQDKQGSKKKINKGEQGQNLQTLALVFDETGRAENEQSPFLDVKIKKPLYNAKSWLNRLIRDTFAKFLAGISTKERNTLKKAEGLEKIRQEYTQRNIPLLVSITTGDFAKAKQFAKEYRMKGFNQTREYLDNHKDELIYRNFKSLQDLLEYVPKEIQREMEEQLSTFESIIHPEQA